MSATIRRGTIVSFDTTTWKALVMLDGSLSEVEMAVGEWVPSALLAADDQVAVLLFEDTNQEDGVILGPFGSTGPQAVMNLPVLSGHRPGAAVIAAVATNHYAAGLPDGVTSSVVWSIKLPPGWAGRSLTVRVHWAPSNTNTGNCRLGAEVLRIDDGVILSSAVVDSVVVLSAGSGTADRPQLVILGALSLASFAEGDAVTFSLLRTGADAADTFTGQANVLSVELSVVGY